MSQIEREHSPHPMQLAHWHFVSQGSSFPGHHEAQLATGAAVGWALHSEQAMQLPHPHLVNHSAVFPGHQLAQSGLLLGDGEGASVGQLPQPMQLAHVHLASQSAWLPAHQD